MPDKLSTIVRSQLMKNSLWSIFSSLLQTLLVSVFFVIMARKFAPGDFAQFLVSTTVYQLAAAFSSLGLGQWFIRQYASETDKTAFTSKFIKMQLLLGLVFYGVSISLAFILYPEGIIRTLCVILGANIVFDNFINSVRSLNIAEGRQRDTAVIMIVDGLMKLGIGMALFIVPLSLVAIAILTIGARFLTVWYFAWATKAKAFAFKVIWAASLELTDLKHILFNNWQFIVIGSTSVIYWRIGNIIISKALSLSDVADYEITYRIFSILQILPVMASATIFPRFIAYVNVGDREGLKKFYRLIYAGYSVFALLTYFFFYSFSGLIIPFIFGANYPGAVACLQQMFLAFLVMPTVLLQANLIVAIGLEDRDMWFNVISLVVYVAACLIGLHFYPVIAVVNYSIFLSFLIFHLLQDILLIKRKLLEARHCLLFYVLVPILIVSYYLLQQVVNAYFLFPAFAAILAVPLLLLMLGQKQALLPIQLKTEFPPKPQPL